MEKSEKKQQIRSLGILSLFFLILGCGVVLLPVWNRESDNHKEFTMHRAESLAYQIVEARFGAQREPSSEAESALNHYLMDEGQIGIDTWGHPFHFKILKNENNHTRVFVWSPGPNGKSENEVSKFSDLQRNGPVSLIGDDLGIMLSIK